MKQLLVLTLLFAGCRSSVGVQSTEAQDFGLGLTDANSKLAPLAAKDKAMRDASRELQRHLDQAKFYIDQSVSARMVELYLGKAAPKGTHDAVEKTIATARAKNKVAHEGVRAAEPKFTAAKKALESELATMRGAARASVKTPNASALLALQVACYDWHAAVASELPTLRTEIKSLRQRKDLGGDITIDGLLLQTCLAMATEDSAVATRIGSLQTPLAALSGRQMRAFERTLVKTLGDVSKRMAMTSTTNAKLFDERFDEIAAVILVLVGDQTRHFGKWEKPALTWLRDHQASLVAYARIDGSILERTGFFVFDHRRNALINISGKAQYAPANTKIFRGKASSRYLKWANAKGGETINQLPAFVASLGLACNAIDFVPAGSDNTVANGFMCDAGCAGGKDASLAKKSKWGIAGFVSPAGSSPKYKATTAACTSAPGGGGGAAAPGGDDPQSDGRGSIGGLLGGAKKCSLGSLIPSRVSDRIASCLASTYPGSRNLGTIGEPVSGGHSCAPSVHDDVTGSDDYDLMGNHIDVVYHDANRDGKDDLVETNDDHGTPDNPDDDTTTITCQSCKNQFVAEEGESYDDAAERFLGSDNGASYLGTPPADAGTEDPPADPPADPAPAPTPTPSNSSNGAVRDTVTGDLWDEEWERINTEDTLDASCVENPECRDPDDPEDDPDGFSEGEAGSCTMDDAGCSSGCTGNDGRSEEFTTCVSDATTPTPSGPAPSDPYTNPAPDATDGYLPKGVAEQTACMSGNVPARDQCRGESIALCPQDDPNCMCGGRRTPEISPALQGVPCEQVMCSGASLSERSSGMNSSMDSSGLGACGCGSVLGG